MESLTGSSATGRILDGRRLPAFELPYIHLLLLRKSDIHIFPAEMTAIFMALVIHMGTVVAASDGIDGYRGANTCRS